MALYFAMIDGERKGPYSLAELHDAGVRPDTYVWAKGMHDWRKAEDVADICRFYRQRLFDKMHPSVPVVESNGDNRPEEMQQSSSGLGLRGYPFPMPEDDPSNIQTPPMPTLAVAIVVMLLCFPPTGIMAIYYSVNSRHLWNKAQEIAAGKVAGNADEFKRDAHDAARKAKMWVGISFFLGLIFYGFMISFMG